MKELFEEYEAGKTPEALLVKDFDKVREGITAARAQPCDAQAEISSYCDNCSADNPCQFSRAGNEVRGGRYGGLSAQQLC